MANDIYTIGREFGSNGLAVGEALAKKLGINFYDKELLQKAAKESGFCEEILENHDEKPTNSFLYSLSLGAYGYGSGVASAVDMPISDKIFIVQSDVIKNLAEKGSCVIVGRCAESILKDTVPLLSVFVHTDFENRVLRVSEEQKIPRDKAADIVRKTDKKRASYHNYYSDLKWGAATSYDLCINSAIGEENAAKLIIDCFSMKQ